MAFERIKIKEADGREFGPMEFGTLQGFVRSGKVSMDATVSDADGGGTRPLKDFLFVAPPSSVETICGQSEPSARETVPASLPPRNGLALTSWYFGLLSLAPFLGLILGPVAVSLGWLGLKHRRLNPAAKGGWCARAGMAVGFVGAVGSLVVVWLMLVVRRG